MPMEKILPIVNKNDVFEISFGNKLDFIYVDCFLTFPCCLAVCSLEEHWINKEKVGVELPSRAGPSVWDSAVT